MSADQIRALNWNVAWAVPKTPRGRAIRRRIDAARADIVCVTEGYDGYLSRNGHAISSDPDYGYKMLNGRRKGMLWSRQPWSNIDRLGHPDLPSGRFVSGVTEAGGIEIQVISLCISWMNAHVATGRKDRRPWQDHLTYIEALSEVLARPRTLPVLIMGDFNQRIPHDRTPLRIYEPLMAALSGLTVATQGAIPPIGRPTVCHILHSPDLAASKLQAIDNHTRTGRLSDHFGLVVNLSGTAESSR